MMSQDFTRVMMEAEKLADKANDKYVTLERILQALSMTDGTKAHAVLSNGGVNPVKLNQAINEYRKGRLADSETAEDNFEALKKFAVDITAKAKEGKLDPVVGRDHEIRRTIQVLSRRTKTIRCSSESRALAKPPLSRGWPCVSSTTTFRKVCVISGCWLLIWAR